MGNACGFFPVLNSVSNDPKGQGFDFLDGLLLGMAVAHDPRQDWDFSNPSAIGFLIQLYRESGHMYKEAFLQYLVKTGLPRPSPLGWVL